MEIINMDQYLPYNTYGHSSKGNQLKFMHDGFWYKADHMGYEGLAEVIVSKLLRLSNVKNYVDYEPVMITYKDVLYHGCRSRNFLTEGEELVTSEHLFRQYTGQGLSQELAHITAVNERIAFFVQTIQDYTRIIDFGKYITMILELDAFFLNEDRHTNNIAVKYNPKAKIYQPCNIFDNGLALFSDTSISFTKEKPVPVCLSIIQAKPFSFDFDEQMDEAAAIFGTQLHFTFNNNDIITSLDEFQDIYDDWILDRIENTLRNQMRKYQYMF
jgi:hypothetical protein